ncbi:MAG: DUF327 family protein [Treponema sp.]|nr:DUF327 family protein [Treponema sp.]
MGRVDFNQGIENALNPGTGNLKSEKGRAKKGGLREIRRDAFSKVLEHSILQTEDLGPLPPAEVSDEALENLLDTVRGAGDSLKRQPLPQQMLDYKKAVRNFLHYVVENSFEVEQFQGIKRKVYVRGEKRWDAKIHHQIKVVDQKLEELASGILLKQINELDLKTRLEEITGLLVDLKVTGKITQD